MTQPRELEDLTTALVADLQAVYDEVLALLVALADEVASLRVTVRQQRARAVLRDVEALIGRADTIAARHVLGGTRTAYEVGAWATALTAGGGATFAAVDVDAITALAQDTMSDLLAATKGMREDVKIVVRDLVRQQVRSKVYLGQTATQAGRTLAQQLADRGIVAVIYRDGRAVSLPVYADMVMRTKTAIAYQEGGLSQGNRLGVVWWEVMDGPGCGWTSHDDPRKADGLIVDLDDARAHPISHPNCRRSTSPRPDIRSADHARRADATRPTDEAVWRAAVEAQAAATGTTGLSLTPERATASVGFDVLPNTAAARRHAATLARHQVAPAG
ncbi:phage minor capsid protein [Cellulomonas sp.]|uniref:phage minor capsid protein n=1 Tax=Cellulomonas sp. TaxID=40001 RepID=UPI001B256597|nr:phage minor capsid protein [Cellulomonas sp.]MBO9555605.1 hypothetical protein [Cellulomonas sp.]